MINRPSYAQRTLDLTRRSLQLLPPVPASTEPAGPETAVVRSLDLGRWRRKSASTGACADRAIDRTTIERRAIERPTIERRLVR